VTTVDSTKQELDMHTVMIMALDNMERSGVGNTVPAKTAMLALVREGGMPTVDIAQFGNTVFVSHTGKGKNKNKMTGRPLNVDTARNYIKNIIKYGAYLQDKGITHFSATFSDENLLSAVKMLQRKLTRTDTELYVGKLKNGKYALFIKLGEDPLQGMA
jgi:hypothetical protein|tara:strand:- start:98 stop:574 length:477 start_codon:yes stop_codon:yes gene_type:complete